MCVALASRSPRSLVNPRSWPYQRPPKEKKKEFLKFPRAHLRVHCKISHVFRQRLLETPVFVSRVLHVHVCEWSFFFTLLSQSLTSLVKAK